MVPLDSPGGVAALLGGLRAADAGEQAAAPAARRPAAGGFGLLLEQEGRADQFRFGREPDGTPAAPWDWDDLDLRPASQPRRSRKGEYRAPPGCPFGDRPLDTPEHCPVGPRGLRERCLVRPVRSIVR
jgi:hypothetical protein